MTTFNISLAIIGGLILAAVVAYNAWAARKSQPKRPEPEPLHSAHHSTTFAESVAPASVSGKSRGLPAQAQEPEPVRLEPRFNMVAEGDSDMAALVMMTPPERKPGLDALIDVIALVMLDGVVSGETALAAMPGTRRAGSKPFAIEGLSAITGDWEVPSAGHRYSAFQCGVQLANRMGPLNQIEYSEFVIKTQAFADAIGGEPEFPEMHDEVARARELDHFAGAHDAQLSFTLRAARTAWSPGYVHQSAARLGFVSGAIPGRMVLPASQPGGAPILGLAFDSQAAMAEDPEQTALREITLSLDVPQVSRTERPFVRMREAAVVLAASMEGVIIDDNGNIIHVDAMDLIGYELEQLYDTLDQRDLSAGSVLARRLFS
ncbi:MAG: cell division protein FtsZ [Pseudomonadota bacterium]